MTKNISSKIGGKRLFLSLFPAVCFTLSLLQCNYLHYSEVAIKYYQPESTVA